MCLRQQRHYWWPKPGKIWTKKWSIKSALQGSHILFNEHFLKIYPNDVILKNTDFTLGSKLATKETIFLHSDSKLVARVKLWCLHVEQYFVEITYKKKSPIHSNFFRRLMKYTKTHFLNTEYKCTKIFT